MKIATTDARALYTKALIAAYQERITPMSFLRSFFKVKEETTFELSIEVQRGFEKVAVDVIRGTEGNRNEFGRSTEKIFVPPYYREFFDATQLSLYDRMFASDSIASQTFAAFVNQIADKMREIQNKIERRYELQCAQVLETGIVTLDKGTNIDFKRKAGSLVDQSATPWTTGTNSPYATLELGAKFIREKGKSQGGTLNAILGETALNAFLGNTIVKERADIRNFNLDMLNTPQKNSVGGTLHGVVSAGSYNVRLWTYPEVYDASGVSTPYVNPKKVIMLPDNPNFVLGFAAVPQLIDEENPVPMKGAFIYGDYKDKRAATHDYDVKSAGVAIPVAVDQIFTAQVIA